MTTPLYTVAEILAATGGHAPDLDPATPIDSISIDSRALWLPLALRTKIIDDGMPQLSNSCGAAKTPSWKRCGWRSAKDSTRLKLEITSRSQAKRMQPG